MRLVSAALVAVGVLAGLGATQSFRTADGALQRASDNAAQLVRLQDIRTSLVRADADATNAFLVGGLEPADQRRDYDQAVERAASLVAFAARAQPADGQALAALGISIQRYTGRVELARATNRQGLPLGAQYLREASAGLRADSLPLLKALTTANQQRVQAEFAAARRAVVLVVVACLLALTVIVAALVWLARRTHRYLNAPVLAAGAVVLLVLAASTAVLGSVGRRVGDVRSGSYAAARALSEARIAAFDAKANESLTLVSRGSGAGFEVAWKASSATTTAQLAQAVRAGAGDADLPRLWASYASQHQQIRRLDDAGQWEQAVAAATSRASGSANATFAAVDSRSAQRLTAAGNATSSGLRDAGRWLALAAWLGVLAGLGTAALAWWGLSQRIEEYR